MQLLAYAIASLDGVAGYSGWRWIFIIEGLVTFVVAVAAKFVIQDFPETAKFLTPQERAMTLRRLKEDLGGLKMDRYDRPATKRVFSDWKIYCG